VAAQLSLALFSQKANQLDANFVTIPGSAKLHHAVSNLEVAIIHILLIHKISRHWKVWHVVGARRMKG
jgi:hypothetical protein